MTDDMTRPGHPGIAPFWLFFAALLVGGGILAVGILLLLLAVFL